MRSVKFLLLIVIGPRRATDVIIFVPPCDWALVACGSGAHLGGLGPFIAHSERGVDAIAVASFEVSGPSGARLSTLSEVWRYHEAASRLWIRHATNSCLRLPQAPYSRAPSKMETDFRPGRRLASWKTRYRYRLHPGDNRY